MPAPKRSDPTVPLSSDPDFRLAQRSWERFSAETKGFASVPKIEVDLDSGDKKTRADAERVASKHLGNLLIAAAAWSAANPEADAEAEIGSSMLPAINWLVRVLKIPTSPDAPVQSAKMRVEHDLGFEEGQRLSESIPPCWSPRWSAQRKLLRTVSPARLSAGEFYSFFIQLIPRIQDKLRARGPGSTVFAAQDALTRQTGLAVVDLVDIRLARDMAKFKVDQLVHWEPQGSLTLKQARAKVKELEAQLVARERQGEDELSMSIPAFIERQFTRREEAEKTSREEAEQIRKKYRLHKEQHEVAWDLLNARRVPREPKAQYEALEELMDEGTKKGSSK